MNSIDKRNALAPWTETMPPDWQAIRIDAVADVLFSNVDKHTNKGSSLLLAFKRRFSTLRDLVLTVYARLYP